MIRCDEIPNSVITALEHKGIIGALTLDENTGLYFAEVRYFGTIIKSIQSKFDLFAPDSILQKNWNNAVEKYLYENEVRTASTGSVL